MTPDAERGPGKGPEPEQRETSTGKPTIRRGLSADETASVREHLGYVAAALDEITSVGTHDTDDFAYPALDELDKAIWLIDGKAV